jgi:hypothetical protein
MRTNDDGPADTRMMGIVHDALRRDLARTRRRWPARCHRPSGGRSPRTSTG